MLYGPTNEELITEIFRSSIKSYRVPPSNAIPHSMEVQRRT